ncbi:MAG: protease inhibitor I42 family protein [Nitrospirota bacterium]
MKKSLVTLALFFILPAAYTTSSFAGINQPTTTNGPKLAKILTMADNGNEIRLGPGEIIKVELKVQGGTGYNWHVDGLDESRLKLIGTETREISPRKIVGGPMQGIWSFEAVAPGDTVIRLLYYRIWEGKARAVKKFEVKLHIAGKQ